MTLELVTFLLDILLEMLLENSSGVSHLHKEALHLLIILVLFRHGQKRRLLNCLLLFHCLFHGCCVGADSDTTCGLFLLQDYHLLFLLRLGLHSLHTLFHGSCIWADNNAAFGLQIEHLLLLRLLLRFLSLHSIHALFHGGCIGANLDSRCLFFWLSTLIQYQVASGLLLLDLIQALLHGCGVRADDHLTARLWCFD